MGYGVMGLPTTGYSNSGGYNNSRGYCNSGVIITPTTTASPNDVVDPGKLSKLSSKNASLTISIDPAFLNICSVSVDS